MEKKEFYLTWLHKIDKPMEKTPKDIFRLRMYFSNDLDVESRIHLLGKPITAAQKNVWIH